jgi:hypothetical protein
VILQTALAIVDRGGVDRWSKRRLSNAVGRDPVTLYRHVPNHAAVLDGVAEIVLAQFLVDNTDPDWAGQLRTVAHHFGQLALAHPNVVPLLVTRRLATPLGQRPPGMLRPLEDVLALLTSAGFAGDDAHTYRVLFGYLLGPHRQRVTGGHRAARGNRSRTSARSAPTRSPNSPYCVRWHPPWPPTTAPPNSTASSICCCPA